MKRQHLFFGVMAALGACALACGEDLTSFEINERSQEAVVMGRPGPSLPLPIDVIPPMQLEVDLEEELNAQSAGPAKGVYLSALDLEVTPTKIGPQDTDDLDFIQSIEVYVESTKPGSTLTRVKVAQLSPVPKGKQRVSLKTESDLNLKPYIEEGVRLTTRGQGTVPPDDVSLVALVTMRVQLL